jgi:hypothetical protein
MGSIISSLQRGFEDLFGNIKGGLWDSFVITGASWLVLYYLSNYLPSIAGLTFGGLSMLTIIYFGVAHLLSSVVLNSVYDAFTFSVRSF